MKKILMTLLLTLLVMISSYSQDSYPKTIVLSGDSLVVITRWQLKATNILLLDREYTYKKLALSDEILALKNLKLEEVELRLKEMNSFYDERDTRVVELEEEAYHRESKILVYKKRVKNRNTVIVTLSAVVLLTLLVK